MRRSPLATLAATCVAFAATAPGFAQAPYEDSPGVSDDPGAWRVGALVEAYNAGDADRIGAIVREHFTGPFAEIPTEQHISVCLDALRRTGPLELLAFRSYDPPREGELVPILRSTVTGAYRAFVLPVEDKPPHRFTGLQFAPARTPSYIEPAEPLTGNALIGAVDELIDRLVARDMFSGTIVIAQNGTPIY